MSANLRTAEQELQTFLDSKLSPKSIGVVEIQDILIRTEAFTIFKMVMCTTHAHRWPDLPTYKLLIIETAHQSPSQAWLEYDLAFQKDAAATTGASYWSKMHLDLLMYNSSPLTMSASQRYISPPPPLYCVCWNNGQCRCQVAGPFTYSWKSMDTG